MKKRAVIFTEIAVSAEPDARSEMVSRAGGAEELAGLDRKGALDRLVAG